MTAIAKLVATVALIAAALIPAAAWGMWAFSADPILRFGGVVVLLLGASYLSGELLSRIFE